MTKQNIQPTTQWFDYWRLSEDRQIIAFMYQWISVHTRFMEFHKLDVNFDKSGKEYIAEFPWKTTGDMLGDQIFMGMLSSLRRTADKNRMPYHNFWSNAFLVLNDSEVCGQLGTEPASEVKIISGSIALKASIVDLFLEEAERKIIMSEEHNMTGGAYTGAPDQVAYHAYVAAMVKERYPDKWPGLLSKLWAGGKYSYPRID